MTLKYIQKINVSNIWILSTYCEYKKYSKEATEKVSVFVEITYCKPQYKIKYIQQKQQLDMLQVITYLSQDHINILEGNKSRKYPTATNLTFLLQ